MTESKKNKTTSKKSDKKSKKDVSKYSKIAEQIDYYLKEDIDFINAIKTDGKTRIPIKEGLETLRLTLAVKKSYQLHKPVKLSEVT